MEPMSTLRGIMEHIEEAGIHSGDSACVMPPVTLSDDERDIMVSASEAIARRLSVVGLLNINCRAARTCLRDRSESTGFSYHSVCIKGDRCAASPFGDSRMFGEKLADLGHWVL